VTNTVKCMKILTKFIFYQNRLNNYPEHHIFKILCLRLTFQRFQALLI
jgi:hypothetical protein